MVRKMLTKEKKNGKIILGGTGEDRPDSSGVTLARWGGLSVPILSEKGVL